MIRRRSTPWIHRWSRPIMGAIAIIGAIGTAFLTVVKLRGDISGVCASGGCDAVLSSPYATVFGLPLTLFGFLGYTAMTVFALSPLLVSPDKNKKLHAQLDRWTGLFLFLGGTAMVIFSSYLMYLLATEIKAVCIYCITSAIFSLSLFILSIVGRAWDDIGQLLFSGIAVAMVTLVGTLGVYAGINGTGVGASSPGAIELAGHLSDTDAKMFGAYWCSHCKDQKELFGEQAFKKVDYVECAEDAENSQTQLCRSEGIQGFPTWKIDGELHDGVKTLDQLADLSDYSGSRDFGIADES
ncbi:vitamin K epoxide reductase family protein [Oscillatoriales cyanobacterium LEGE 11467]|uniref:Vitamin K epoxide reductase family protein n=1 Tax=Zarconia navalis LEGE 11467 TaxID=1828826 RepID=A0A928Z849_9CYAN|nr:vitamin K epoxide reductase family protein [Zarconia navalis]MBE9039461.1 vitamin K epoxide reductase family protein [Zarconia navalis LEGE 11467]